ncbi:MAG: nucleotidyltransferase domain-containing protein [Candidatus Thorarchaeota archaeon]
MQTTSEILDRIVALLASDSRVGAIYLFGSVAHEVAGEQSDIDFALLSRSLQNPLKFDDIIQFRTKVAMEFPELRFDLVLVDQCPPMLQCEILKHEPIFCVNKDWEALEKSRFLRIAWDALALARPHEQALLHSLKGEGKK